jgi:hypothetical protein
VINRQQEEMVELSTPVVKLWDSILALPMIGTLDSARTQVVMESLLQTIVDTSSELHGGPIAAHSGGTNQGSRFNVTLPLSVSDRFHNIASAPSKVGPPEAASETDSVRLDGVRVLIVDDDLDARNMLSRILRGCGAVTQDADGVDSALTSIDSFKPAMLLSDLGMPNRDGFELIGKVRSRGHSARDLPAIALTGFARPEDRRRALLAGFQVHIAKPIDPRELTAAIASLISRTGGTPMQSSEGTARE